MIEEEKPKDSLSSALIDFAKKFRYELAAPPAILLFFFMIVGTDFYNQFEYMSQEWRFKARTTTDEKADKRIIVKTIDEYSLERFGAWPWRRNLHGEVLKMYYDAELYPSVFAFDVMFLEPSGSAEDENGNEVDHPNDVAFAEGMLYHTNVITGAFTLDDNESKHQNPDISNSLTAPISNITGDIYNLLSNRQYKFPIPLLRESSYFAFVDVHPSRVDGIRWRYPLLVRYGEEVYPSLALQSVIKHFDVYEDDVEVVLGKFIRFETEEGIFEIPVNEDGEMFVNYRNKDGFNGLPYAAIAEKLLYMDETGEAWPEDFPAVDGSIILIGQSATGLADLGPTPLDSISPLVLVHANVINNILKSDYVKTPDSQAIAFWLIILMWVTLVLFKDKRMWISIGLPVVIIGIYVGVAFYTFATESLQMPFVWPTASFAFVHIGANYLHWRREMRSKQRIKGMFGTYLSPELVHQMVESGDEPKLGGIDANITAFFSDVQSFSTFSEKLTPEQLVDLMNEYLTAMTDILMEEQCYVDKYIGDAIVGIFNAPIEVKDHALRGCIASQRMQKRQAELREKWASEGDKWPDIVAMMQTRMGLNTGHATVGNMGSERRFNYTMMGDTVNLAARSESGAKSYGVYTMVTGETKEEAEKYGDDCVFRYLDKIVVKGRSKPAVMYEVVCLREDLNPEIEKCLDVYNHAMDNYLEQDFKRAIELFEKAAKLEPNRKELNEHAPTTPSLVMLERCHEYKDDPPGEGWDGVYVMKTK